MSLRRRRRIWLPNQFFWEDRCMLSRRIFVTTALGAGAVLATQDHKAAAQADRRMIVDAQIHLWKAESEDWRWVPGLQPQLPEPFQLRGSLAAANQFSRYSTARSSLSRRSTVFRQSISARNTAEGHNSRIVAGHCLGPDDRASPAASSTARMILS